MEVRKGERTIAHQKIEHQVTLEELQNLNAVFQEYEKRGRQLLDMETFKGIMKRCMRSQNKSIEQIEQLFMKIDYAATGRIQWDGVCTYLQLEYLEQAAALARQKEVSFLLPALLQGLPHGGPVLRILSAPDDTLITVREDGAVYFWSPQLKLKRRKRVFDKPTSRKPKWVMDATSMPQYNKLIVATGNRELQLYELSNLEPYCQIGSLEALPLKLDYWLLLTASEFPLFLKPPVLWMKAHRDSVWPYLSRISEDPIPSYMDPDKCLILYGDDQGCVNLLFLTSVGELLRTWKKLPKVGNMPNLGIHNAVASPNVNYIRWKVHGDWVTQLNYYDSIKAVISSSNHDPTALVIGMLKSHLAPVIYIHVSAEDNKIFSMSNDNAVKIWDLETYSCLFTAPSKASGIKGDHAACLYLPCSRALCVANDAVALLCLRLRSAPEPRLVVSHKEPVVCCRYNPAFRHVVSCSEASVVKVWDFESGRLLSEFMGTHGNAGISCLTFDSSGRRLVTGGRDGCLKIWSYTGHCLHTLKHDKKQSEVCDCAYLEVNQNRYIIAVGWDRRINVYFDAPCDFHHFWKPQPHWQDDLNHGHKEDVLCVAECPPFLLATSSYDGEIIIWNVISGHMYCKLNSPSGGPEDREGPERSVSCLAFLRTRAAKLDAAASLLAGGPRGSVTFWRLFGGACLIANFTPSRREAHVSSIVVTAEDTLAYVADREGFLHIYDIKEYGSQGPELQPPRNVKSWRAHVSVVTGLELAEGGRFLLSSSSDGSVRLWSADGAYVGTFGQSSPWDIFTPASWSHPRVPYEILMHPQSRPAHPVLAGDVPAVATGEEGQDEPEKISDLHTPGEPMLEAEMKGKRSQRLQLGQKPPSQGPREPGWPSVYQALRCHEVACVSTLGERPDLSAVGSDSFDLNFPAQERAGRDATQTELCSSSSSPAACVPEGPDRRFLCLANSTAL